MYLRANTHTFACMGTTHARTTTHIPCHHNNNMTKNTHWSVRREISRHERERCTTRKQNLTHKTTQAYLCECVRTTRCKKRSLVKPHHPHHIRRQLPRPPIPLYRTDSSVSTLRIGAPYTHHRSFDTYTQFCVNYKTTSPQQRSPSSSSSSSALSVVVIVAIVGPSARSATHQYDTRALKPTPLMCPPSVTAK